MSACGFNWCTNSGTDHKEHTWTDAVEGSSLAGKLRRVAVWNSIEDGFAEPIMISIEGGPEEVDDGAESWLTLDQAAYLRDTLTKAIANASGAVETAGAAGLGNHATG